MKGVCVADDAKRLGDVVSFGEFSSGSFGRVGVPDPAEFAKRLARDLVVDISSVEAGAERLGRGRERLAGEGVSRRSFGDFFAGAGLVGAGVLGSVPGVPGALGKLDEAGDVVKALGAADDGLDDLLDFASGVSREERLARAARAEESLGELVGPEFWTPEGEEVLGFRLLDDESLDFSPNRVEAEWILRFMDEVAETGGVSQSSILQVTGGETLTGALEVLDRVGPGVAQDFARVLEARFGRDAPFVAAFPYGRQYDSVLFGDFPPEYLPRNFNPASTNQGAGTLFEPAAFAGVDSSGNSFAENIFGPPVNYYGGALSGEEFLAEVNALLKNADEWKLQDAANSIYSDARNIEGLYGPLLYRGGVPAMDPMGKMVKFDSPTRASLAVATSPSYGLLTPVDVRTRFSKISSATDAIADAAKKSSEQVVNLLNSPAGRVARGADNEVHITFSPMSLVVAKLLDALRLAFEPRLGGDLQHISPRVSEYENFIYTGDFNYLAVMARLNDALANAKQMDLNQEWRVLDSLEVSGDLPGGPFGVPRELKDVMAKYDFNPFARSIANIISDLAELAFTAQNTPPGEIVFNAENSIVAAISRLYGNRSYGNYDAYQDYVTDMLQLGKRNLVAASDYEARKVPVDWPDLELTYNNLRVPIFDEQEALLVIENYADRVDRLEYWQDSVDVSPLLRKFDDAIAPYGSATELNARLLAQSEDIDSIPKAVVFWQHVGNENIQDVLRFGRVRSEGKGRAIEKLMSDLNLSEDEVLEMLKNQAETAIPFLDDFISSASPKQSVVVYRGVKGPTMEAMFGDDWTEIKKLNDSENVSLEGTGYDEPGFLAFSLSPIRASGFGIGGAILRFEIPSNLDYASVNGHLPSVLGPNFLNEYELLLPRGARVNFKEMITARDLRNSRAVRGRTGQVRWDGDTFAYFDTMGNRLASVAKPVINIELEY